MNQLNALLVFQTIKQDEYKKALELMTNNIIQIENNNELMNAMLNNLNQGNFINLPYDEIFTKIQQLSDQLPKRTCGNELNQTPAVICTTCCEDQNAIFCLECFDQEKHLNHHYQFKNGHGMCDCGFEWSMKPDAFCSKHQGAILSKTTIEESGKGILKPKNVADVVYFLFTGFLMSVKNKQGNTATQFAEIINQFLYCSNIDMIKRIISNYLFLSLDKINSSKEIIQDYHFTDLLPEYQLSQQMNSFDDITSNKLLMNIFLNLHQLGLKQNNNDLNKAIQIMDRNLEIKQMGDLSYRILLLYTYYNYFDSLMYNHIQNSNNIWDSAVCQICSNIHFNEFNMFIYEIYLFDAFYKMAFSSIKQCQNQFQPEITFVKDTINSIFYNGIQQFQSYKMKNNNVLAIINDLIPKINRIIGHIMNFRMLTTEDYNIYNYIEHLHYSLSSSLYAYNSLEYVYLIASNDLICFLELNYQYLAAQLQLPRYRDRDAVKYDDSYTQYISFFLQRQVSQYRDAWCFYLASIGENQDNIDILDQNTVCNISRTSKMVKVIVFDSLSGEDKKLLQRQQLIKRILYMSIYFILTLTCRSDQHFMYSTDCKYQDVPVQHGVHVADPIYQTDSIFSIKSMGSVNDASPEFQHSFSNIYVMHLFFQLNAWEQLFKTCSSPILLERCGKAVAFQQAPHHNVALLVAAAVRLVVSTTLLAANGFRKLVQAEWVLRRLLFEFGANRGAFSWFAAFVLQRAARIHLKQKSTQKFIFQLFEAFGVAHMQTGEYINRVSSPGKESADTMHKMMHALLTLISTIALKNQGFADQEQYVEKIIIQLMIASLNPTERIINEQINQSAVDISYAMKVFHQIANAKEREIMHKDDVYLSFQDPDKYFMSRDALDKCSIFDAALYAFPQYLSSFESYCEQNKMNYKIPRDCTSYNQNNCYDNNLANDIFKNQMVIQLICDLIKLMIENEKLTDPITDHDQLVCLIALQQIWLYNPDNIQIQELIEQLRKVTFQSQESSCEVLKRKLFFNTTTITKNENESKPIQRLKDKLQQLKKTNINKISQLSPFEKDELQNEEQTDDIAINPRFMNIMQTIQEGVCCIICLTNPQEKTLSSYGSITIDGIFGKIGNEITYNIIAYFELKGVSILDKLAILCNSQNIYLHLCGHLVHDNCCEDVIKSCDICRQQAMVTFPLIQGSEIDIKAVIRFIANSIAKVKDYNISNYSKKLQLLLNYINTDNDKINRLQDIDYRIALEDKRTQEQPVDNSEETKCILIIQVIRILLNLLVTYGTMNIRAYQIRFQNDNLSTDQEKNKYYLQLLQTTCSIMLYIDEIKRYLDLQGLQKRNELHFIEYQLPQLYNGLNLDAVNSEGNIALGTALLWIVTRKFKDNVKQQDQQFQQSEVFLFLKDLNEIYGASIYIKQEYDNFNVLYNQNYENMLLSKYKYLISDRDPGNIYQTYLYLRRQSLLQSKKNVFSCKKSPKMQNFDLNRFFNTSFINMLKSIIKTHGQCEMCKQKKLLVKNQRIIVCLQCGMGLCKQCAIASEMGNRSHCSCTGFYYIPLLNYVLIGSLNSHNIVATGGPYLDENGEDDPGQEKHIPLYLNGMLLLRLQKTVFWDLRHNYTIDKFSVPLNDVFQ